MRVRLDGRDFFLYRRIRRRRDDAKADDLFIKGDKYEEELKAKAELAKEESKKIKKPEDAKKFIEKNKDKIAEVSKKLKGKAKEDFDKVV